MAEFDDSFYSIITISCYLNSYFPNESYFDQTRIFISSFCCCIKYY